MATQPLVAEMTDEQSGQHAFSLLVRELGISGYVRFLRVYCSGKDDYTAERHAGLTVEGTLESLESDTPRNQ